MDAGVHLPQIEFAGEELSLRRLADTVDAARENGFAAVSVNDHFLFGAPWLDGLTALAAVAERSGPMTLATTVSLAALRGPVPLAKALATLDILSGGRVLAGVGPGSSRSDGGGQAGRRLPARAGHDVDVDNRGSRRGRTGHHWPAGAAAEA
jgi:alkanesulfonate monooxygenase SsuD/methylene tetrahydromethanopterin reductase-like flavin-dependent oxidoreductase (luciferase family)